jgi:hypothetical protein
MWIGTADGILQFDGVRFVRWTPGNGRPGDILLGVDEQNFGHQGPTSLVFRLEPNRDAKIAGIRGGQQFSTTIHVGERPRRQA